MYASRYQCNASLLLQCEDAGRSTSPVWLNRWKPDSSVHATMLPSHIPYYRWHRLRYVYRLLRSPLRGGRWFLSRLPASAPARRILRLRHCCMPPNTGCLATWPRPRRRRQSAGCYTKLKENGQIIDRRRLTGRRTGAEQSAIGSTRSEARSEQRTPEGSIAFHHSIEAYPVNNQRTHSSTVNMQHLHKPLMSGATTQ